MAVISITCAVDTATSAPATVMVRCSTVMASALGRISVMVAVMVDVMDTAFPAVGTVVAAFASAATSWSTAALAARACNFAGFLIDCTTGAVNSVASLTAVSTLARLPTGIAFSTPDVASAAFTRSFGVRTADC